MEEPKPQVGWWYTYCCEDDLAEIDTPELLVEILEDDKFCKDDGLSGYTFWPTKEEALKDLRPSIN